MSKRSLICLYQEHVSDIVDCLEKITSYSFNALATPIVNPLFYREFDKEPMKLKHLAFSRSDLILNSDDWYQKIISVITDSVDCDSKNLNVRRHSEKTVMQELSFAEHVVQQGLVMIKLKSKNCTNLARITSKSIKGILIVSVPMINPNYHKSVLRSDKPEDDVNMIFEEDTWHWWNQFRTVADYNNSKIKIALELVGDPPPNSTIQRWLGEPVEYIIITSELFIRNKCNFPVLSKKYQEILVHFIRNNVNFILKANLEDENIRHYYEYLKHLNEKYKVVDILQEFDDVLQIPLQPLFDNLDSYTYEVFERDPIKYKLYQDAIELALIDKVPESEKNTKTIVIMVLGAGRGPLVRASLNASTNTKRKIKIYIVEKNPNAIITLTALINELWADKDIQLFPQDMREFTPPEKADILVSELLGSFGDNELSPECLDGAQRHLKEDGISIPCKSTSYINPIMYPKLFDLTRQICSPERSLSYDKGQIFMYQADNTYVVYLKSAYHIARPQKLFEFNHPNKSEIIDNSRFKCLQFNIENDCVLHGFGGYFDTVLYKDIKFSIHPETHTKGLFSWFSMYIPISSAYHLKAGDVLEVNFWRCTSIRKIWYEWNITKPYPSRIYNSNGTSSVIYL